MRETYLTRILASRKPLHDYRTMVVREDAWRTTVVRFIATVSVKAHHNVGNMIHTGLLCCLLT